MSPYAGGSWIWQVAVLLMVFSSSALGDDRRLFRSTPSPPYVFFLLDASAGMRLRFDGTWAPAANDDPSSRMYQAKKALFEGVGEAGDSASFGWATLQVRNFEAADNPGIYTDKADKQVSAGTSAANSPSGPSASPTPMSMSGDRDR